MTEHIHHTLFMPHKHCYLQEQWLVWVTVLGEALISFAYFGITLLISVAVLRFRGTTRFVLKEASLYAAFIFLCGLTHLVGIITYFNPIYFVKAWLVGLTALVSLCAFFRTPFLVQSITKLISIALEYRDMLKPSIELERYVEKLRSEIDWVIMKSPNAIAKVSVEGKFLYASNEWLHLTGYKYEDLIGKTFQEITTPETLKIDLQFFEECISGKRDTYTVQKEYYHGETGDILSIILSVVTVRHPDGTPDFFISQIRVNSDGSV